MPKKGKHRQLSGHGHTSPVLNNAQDENEEDRGWTTEQLGPSDLPSYTSSHGQREHDQFDLETQRTTIEHLQKQLQQVLHMLNTLTATKGSVAETAASSGRMDQRNAPVPAVGRQDLHFSVPDHRAKKMDSPMLPSPDDVSLASFKSWRQRFRGYVTVSRLYEECSLQARQSLLSASLETGWDDLWSGAVLGVTPTDDVEDIIAKIGDYVRRHRNPILDRRQFLQRNQKPGETVDKYYAALRQIDDNCNYEECVQCPNCHGQTGAAEQARAERLRDRIISGLLDADIQGVILKVPFAELTLEHTLQICRAEEAARETQNELHSSVINMMKGKNPSQARSKMKHKSSYKKQREQEMNQNKLCGKCGFQHPRNNCPAYDKECHKCYKKGHFISKCRTMVDSVIPRFVGTIDAFCSLDTISLEFNTKDGKYWKKIKGVLPDTGSGANLMNTNVYHKLGRDPQKLKRMGDVLEAANNLSINTMGRASFKIRYGKVQVMTQFIITDQCKRGVLLNQKICKQLGIVHKQFPIQVLPVDVLKKTSKNFNIDVLKEYQDVFDGDKPLKPMDGPPMVIKLKQNAEPFQVRGPRPIPLPIKAEAKQLIDDQVARGVLTKVDEPTEWVHGMRLVRKANGKLRLCVDLRPLNKYVERPHHPLKAPRDVISSIPPTAKWFSTFDAASGYFQVPLAKESQDYTCFLTEWGRYKFQRATMGLVSAGDEYNRRTEEALEGIPGLIKLVDDICIYSEEYDDHIKKINLFLDRCRAKGITLNPEKMKLAQTEVKFAGYIIGREGIKADPEKLAAIRNFPTPKNITDLRSFQGLEEQLGNFSTAVAEAMRPLRPLLSPRTPFTWTKDHDSAFDKAKEALSAPPVLTTFDPRRQTCLETDAARTKGLGYVLRQLTPEGTWKLIEAGSRFLTDAETRYSMVELELLAVVWATKKCHIYISGLPEFSLVVDHQPLHSILDKKTLDQVETPRIQRLKMALTPYNFVTTWKPGRENAISDALSRAPVNKATKDDLHYEEEIKAHSTDVLHVAATAIEREEANDKKNKGSDRILRELADAANKDANYQILITSILEDKAMPAGYKNCEGRLAVDQGLVLLGQRLIIPQAMRKNVLCRLHASHQGIERTQRRARQTVYWPGITSDIRSLIENCESCQRLRPSLCKEPLEWDRQPSNPFQEIGADFFECFGNHFLVMVDRYSGYPLVESFTSKPGAMATIGALCKIFAQFGSPKRFFSDGGKQFTAKETQDFLVTWGIDHRVSSAGYAQSNGLAEAAVKSVKCLLEKYKGKLSTKFYEGLLELRNTPQTGGKSAAEIVFEKPLRSRVPAHAQAYSKENLISQEQHDAKKAEVTAKAIARYDSNSKTLPPLRVGDHVLVQNMQTKRWDNKGTVVFVGRSRDYQLKMSNGRLWWRNRRFLRRLPKPKTNTL